MTAAELYQIRLSELRGGWVPEDYSTRLLLTDTRICIASDVHIPYHDEALVAQMLDHCKKSNIQAIVWLGDLLDVPTFSSWGRSDYTTDFTRELRIARGLVEMASGIVQVQYWSRGNHEQRWMRKLENQVYMDQLARMAGLEGLIDDGRLIMSDNPSLDALGGGWLLTHPSVYGKVPLDVPGKLAQKYRKNVMSGHAHHWGMAAVEGFVVVETGGLFDPTLHEYIQHNITTHRNWQQGYWFLVDGIATGYRKETN